MFTAPDTAESRSTDPELAWRKGRAHYGGPVGSPRQMPPGSSIREGGVAAGRFRRAAAASRGLDGADEAAKGEGARRAAEPGVDSTPLPAAAARVGSRPQGLQRRPEGRAAGAGEAGAFSIREDVPQRPQAGAREGKSREPETPGPAGGWGGQGRPRAAASGAEETRPGTPRLRYPSSPSPPSLMMIFLASMMLRFAALFFFFPWVILPSSIPGAAAASSRAAGPSGECRPATTAGPSRSGLQPLILGRPASGGASHRAIGRRVRSAPPT